MKSIALFALLLSFLVAMPAAWSADYVIDTKGSHAFINARFKHLGYSVLYATFRRFEGRFGYDPVNLAASEVEIDIDVSSIDSNHAERDKHMRSAKFLDTGRYPRAHFVSTRIEPGEGKHFIVHGKLTLRGVTRPIAIDAALIGEGKDPWGGYRAGFKGYVTLDMRDYGVNTFVPLHKVDMELLIEGKRTK